jgi:redox-sensing transcriptional repressor
MGRDRERVPGSVLRRFVQYHGLLRRVRLEGREWVSSQVLAETLGLTSSTVRQDLLHLDYSGVSKRGYRTEGLEQAMASVLGADTRGRLVIVGAGNIGRSLALHGGFTARGFDICGIFDRDARMVGQRVGRLRVQGMGSLADVVRRKQVDLGVITVPAASAQAVADQLAEAGVRGLLNVAPVHLRVAGGVPVVEVRLVESLQELWYAIRAGARGG